MSAPAQPPPTLSRDELSIVGGKVPLAARAPKRAFGGHLQRSLAVRAEVGSDGGWHGRPERISAPSGTDPYATRQGAREFPQFRRGRASSCVGGGRRSLWPTQRSWRSCELSVGIALGDRAERRSGGRKDTTAEQIEVGPTEHLALEHLQPIGVAFDRPRTPALREAGDDGVLIPAEAHQGVQRSRSLGPRLRPDRFAAFPWNRSLAVRATARAFWVAPSGKM